MDFIKSVFGISNAGDKSGSLQFNADQNKQDINKVKEEKDANNSSVVPVEKVENLSDKFHAVVTRVIPLAEDDCLSCKLLGTSVLWGASMFVLVSAITRRNLNTGHRKTVYLLGATSLSFSLMLLGSARLFDLSIFQKDNEKNLIQLAVEDSEKLYKFMKKKSDNNK